VSTRTIRRLIAALAVVVAVVNAVLAAGSNYLSLSAQEAGRGDLPRINQAHFQELQRLGEARFVLLLSALALLATVPGLVRGRRGAWWVAFAAAVGSVAGHAVNQLPDAGLVLSVVFLVVVLVTRSRFAARANPARITQGLSTIAVGLGLVLVYGAVGIYYLDASFRESTTVFGSLYESARLVLLLPTAVVEPSTGHGFWFISSIRVLAVVVIVAGLARALAPAVIGPSIHETARHHVERLLEQYADSSLAPFHLLDDKAWFFASDGEAVVSYRLIGSVAVALGAPIGAQESCARGLREFLTQCIDSGWTPVFHQVRDADRAVLEGAGLRLLKIGEEAIVPLDEFSLEGSHMKSLRSTLKRVERVGSRFEVLDGPIDDATMDELREVSDSWMTASGHRERTFTVGSFDPAYLRATTIAVVRDGDDRIVAFANILPSYHSNEGNFDLMRRRPDSVNGVMELLFVSLIEHFRAQRLTGMNLGLAPLAGVEGDGVASRVLRAVRDYGGAVFNFEGLQEFKAKWRPRWESRYIAYERDIDLPRIAVGITRAGELEPEKNENRLVGVAKRYPFSLTMIGLTLWFSIATNLDPGFEHVLRYRFGVSYRDLVHLEWWRAVTSPIIEPRAGFVWVNLALIVLALPVAERRLGTSRTVAIFFVGGFVASVPVLLVLRLVGALGSQVALANALAQGAGPSSGCWALAAALAFTIGSPRWRRIAAAAVFTVLVAAFAVMRDLSGAQHLVAASAGALLGWWWSRPTSEPAVEDPGAPPRAASPRPPADRTPIAAD
jgi:phosphatidylglycerol lysyltransferase